MGLEIVQEDGLSLVTVWCDYCGGMIDKASDGNFVWDLNMPSRVSYPIRFEHKVCTRESLEDDPTLSTGELAWLPIYLGNNLEIDWNEARAGVAIGNWM